MGVRKRWQFLWCDENSPPKNGDSHDWHTKVFRVATFEKAMDRMLAFVQAKPFVCLVDYECRAVHVTFVPAKHGEAYLRIDRTTHDLKEYLNC